ncbi:MAG: ankyrin repeat domain-containing protein [Chromatiales bacterium]|nr:ankyrin repeat domain-containing protein [Chromatiales bacterium]
MRKIMNAMAVLLLAKTAVAGAAEVDDRLYRAAIFSNRGEVEALIKKGANANHQQNQRSMLGWAAQSGNVNAVRELLAAGANPNAVDAIGHTPVMRAVETQKKDVVKLLLDSGASTQGADVYGRTLAHLAVETDDPAIVAAVLDAGADFNAKDADGLSPLFKTLQNFGERRNEIVALLAKHGVDLNQGSPYSTPLLFAIENQDAQLLKMLLEAGADPNVANESGRRPLHEAVADLALARQLFKAGADPNITDRFDEPLLFSIMNEGRPDLVEAFLEAGADANRPRSDGQTPLGFARDTGQTDLEALLKRHGAVDGDASPAAPATATIAKLAAQPAGTAPHVPSLPRYAGANAMFEQDAIAIYVTSDPVPAVGEETLRLLEGAGWSGGLVAQNPELRHMRFTRSGWTLEVQVSLARGLGNQTSIQYSLLPQR